MCAFIRSMLTTLLLGAALGKDQPVGCNVEIDLATPDSTGQTTLDELSMLQHRQEMQRMVNPSQWLPTLPDYSVPTLPELFAIKSGGRCLDWTSSEGHNVYMMPCRKGLSHQKWYFDGLQRLKTSESGTLCLDWTIRHGHNAYMWECHLGDHQKWQFEGQALKTMGSDTWACLDWTVKTNLNSYMSDCITHDRKWTKAPPVGCAEEVVVSGAEDLYDSYMGVYKKTNITPSSSHQGRAIYENTEYHYNRPRYLYFWSGPGWLISPTNYHGNGPTGGYNDGYGFLSSPSGAFCPEDSSDWKVWKDSTGWTSHSVFITKACPEKVVVSGGAGNYHGLNLGSYMGTYTKTDITPSSSHQGRAIYENKEYHHDKPRYLYFWSGAGWLVSPTGYDTDVHGYNDSLAFLRAIGAFNKAAECPQDTIGWEVVNAEDNTWDPPSQSLTVLVSEANLT